MDKSLYIINIEYCQQWLNKHNKHSQKLPAYVMVVINNVIVQLLLLLFA